MVDKNNFMMKLNILIILVTFFVFSCASTKLERESGIMFSIVFGDCYNQDTITVSINDVKVIDKAILKSDFSSGLTRTWISHIQKSNDLIVESEGVQTRVHVPVQDSFLLSATKNGQTFKFNLDLKRGKYIVVEGCNAKIKVKQFKRKMMFE